MAKKSSPHLTEEQIKMFKDTANQLEPKRRRRFMHLVVSRLGYGGQRYAEQTLGWNRRMIRQGAQEAKDGDSSPFSKTSLAPKSGGFSTYVMDPITDKMAEIYQQTANNMTGEKRRMFMAQVVNSLGHGGQRYVEERLSWNRGTIRRGQLELKKQTEERQSTQSERVAQIAKEREAKRLSPAETKPTKVTLTDEMRKIYIDTANGLTGMRRRIFMAQVVITLGYGGQRLAEKELGWHRKTIRLGITDLKDRKAAKERLSKRGRKSISARFPSFKKDIQAILKKYDPDSLKTGNTSILIKDIHSLLVSEKGYDKKTVPSRETVRKKLNSLLSETATAAE